MGNVRFEIVIPDDSSAELASDFQKLTAILSSSPGAIKRIFWEDESDIQAKFTPEVLMMLDDIEREVEAGGWVSASDYMAARGLTFVEEKSA